MDSAYRLRALAHKVATSAPRNWPPELLQELRLEIEFYEQRRKCDAQQAIHGRTAERDR